MGKLSSTQKNLIGTCEIKIVISWTHGRWGWSLKQFQAGTYMRHKPCSQFSFEETEWEYLSDEDKSHHKLKYGPVKLSEKTEDWQ